MQLTPDGPVGPWLRVGAAKPRRPVGLASLRSEPEHDGEGVADERDGPELAEERPTKTPASSLPAGAAQVGRPADSSPAAPRKRQTKKVAPRAEGLERKTLEMPLTPDGPCGPWLREGGAKRRRPVGLASLRSEPERDGGGVAAMRDGPELAEERSDD